MSVSGGEGSKARKHQSHVGRVGDRASERVKPSAGGDSEWEAGVPPLGDAEVEPRSENI